MSDYVEEYYNGNSQSDDDFTDEENGGVLTELLENVNIPAINPPAQPYESLPAAAMDIEGLYAAGQVNQEWLVSNDQIPWTFSSEVAQVPGNSYTGSTGAASNGTLSERLDDSVIVDKVLEIGGKVVKFFTGLGGGGAAKAGAMGSGGGVSTGVKPQGIGPQLFGNKGGALGTGIPIQYILIGAAAYMLLADKRRVK